MIFYKLLKILSKLILFPFIFLDRLRWLSEWYFFKKCSPPAPHFIKQSLLLRHGINNSVWVETGTYLGQTTKFLSEHFSFVHSIEPGIHISPTISRSHSFWQKVMKSSASFGQMPDF